MNEINKTAQDVQTYVQNGDFNNALGLAKDILVDNPNDVYCLSIVAQSEFSSGNLQEAASTLRKALEIEPHEINLNRNLGLIYNKTGDFKQSVKCFLSGIENNSEHPEILLDVLLLGISLDKISNHLARNVIEFVFSQSFQLSKAYMNKDELPLISEASSIANHIIRDGKYNEQKIALDELALGFGEDDKKRLYDFLDVFHGIQPPHYADDLQRPTYHVFPGLDPVPFYDASDFDWTDVLEENFTDIKNELMDLYSDASNVKPYIEGVVTGDAGLDGLANSLEWSSIHLIKAGTRNQDLLNKCPVTQKVLTQLPMPVLAGNAPEVFLSVLKPGAEIKPHFGLSNIKLTVHLGLEIPENCAIRVGQETQSWSDGKVMIFDDSFEHEAWNRSDKERKVLIIEVWHPDLTDLEKQGITKIMAMQVGINEALKNTSLDALINEIKTVV
jgi:aspartate beta-hydroxylase